VFVRFGRNSGKKRHNELFYFINTNEIPGELSCENRITSRVKRSQLLWLHNKVQKKKKKAIKVKLFGISLVFI